MNDDQRSEEAQELADLLDAVDEMDGLLTPEYVEQRLREVLERAGWGTGPAARRAWPGLARTAVAVGSQLPGRLVSSWPSVHHEGVEPPRCRVETGCSVL
jgi:hypothetical protein